VKAHKPTLVQLIRMKTKKRRALDELEEARRLKLARNLALFARST